MIYRICISILSLLAISCASAQTAPGQTEPDRPATAAGPGGVKLSPDSSLEHILQALHVRGEGLKDFTSDVSLADIDALTGDTSTLKGKVWYQSLGQGDARLRVLFDQRQIGERVDPHAKVEYLLDKGWLVDRDYKRKIEITRQVLKPGQKMDLLKLGEGPFPLPVGQAPAEVQKQFEVSKIAPAESDPANTVHIQLTPRPGTQFERKFKTIDVWIDAASNFPRRIETVDPRETAVRQTNLGDIQVNTGLGDQAFALQPVEGWTRKSEELQE